jgi:hypothetical protein
MGLIVAWLLPFVLGCGGGLLLSRTNIVSNDDYPGDLKSRIAALKATLSEQDAKRILRESLSRDTVRENEPLLDTVADDGFHFTVMVKRDDRTEVRSSQSAQTSTTYSHLEPRPVQVPFADIRHIRILTDGSRRRVDLVTPVKVLNPPYYGVALFRVLAKTNADEPGLIASLLLLCSNLEESSWASF